MPQLPQTPVQLPTTPSPMVSPTKPQPTVIRMASPVTAPGILRTVGAQGQNIVRLRAPTPNAPQHIKVVGSSGQIIKSTTVSAASVASAGGQTAQAGGNMTGIAALAAAAAATSKISSPVTGTTSNVTAALASGAQTIKVVQAGPGNVITAGGKTIQGGQLATIGGQTVRLASPGGTLLKTAGGQTITGPGGKQIILQQQPGQQPKIVTLVKTSQGMQVSRALLPYVIYELLDEYLGIMSNYENIFFLTF